MSQVRSIIETQQFKDLVTALKEGKTTRKEMAITLGIVPPVLSRCFRIAGLLDELKKTKQSSLNPNNMDKLLFGDPDKDRAEAYRKATEEALSVGNIRQVAAKYPDINYQVLARRVRATKLGKRDAISTPTALPVQPEEKQVE